MSLSAQNFQSDEERRQYQIQQQRVYKREYQREYQRCQREKMIEDQRQDERRSNELQRQNYARRMTQLSVEELEFENRDQQNSYRSCRQRTSDGVSYSEIQGRHQVVYNSMRGIINP